MGRFRKAFLVMVKIVGWLQKRVNFRKTETRKPLCRKALRRFQKMGLTKSYYVPNHAFYQLNYTRIFNFCHYTTAREIIKDFLSVVIYVVKAAFMPFLATGKNPAIARAARLCGVSPYPVPDTATALPNQARYQLRYTRILLILE